MGKEAGEKTVDAIERRERPTIMSGRVVTFAVRFEDRPGIFGPDFDVRGPFEVSASRDAVMVHRADIRTEEHRDQLARALTQAWEEHQRLRKAW